MRVLVLVSLAAVCLMAGCGDGGTKPAGCPEEWTALGSGLDGGVSDLASDGIHLYAGGAFGKPGEPFYGLKVWDGVAWTRAGSDTFDVFVMTIHGGFPIVYGEFGFMNMERRIARWDGRVWRSMSADLDAPMVYDLVEYEGALVAGGRIHVGEEGAIVRWTGEQWQAIGHYPQTGAVVALCAHKGELFAAGAYLPEIDGVPVPDVAHWDGLHWRPAGGVGDSSALVIRNVSAMASDGNALFAAGELDLPGGELFYGLATWDESNWQPFGDLIWGKVQDIAFYEGQPTVCGKIGPTREEAKNQVMRWSGSQWLPLGERLDGGRLGWVGTGVAALVMHQGALVAGGWFTHAGTVEVNSVAQWCR